MKFVAKTHLLLPLAVPLLLAACVSQSTYDEAVAQNQQLRQQVSSLTAQVSAAQTQVGRLQSAIKYTVDSDLLFPPGGWEMSAAGKDVIGKFTTKLAPTQQNKLVVNGYTDNAPVGRELQRKGLVSEGVQPSLVSAVGHGDADPVASNKTAPGRAKNRRVELTLGGPAAR